MFRKVLSLVVLMLCLAVGLVWFLYAKPSSNVAETQPVASLESVAPAESLTHSENVKDPLALALKQIELAQGKGGAQEWRLKATWATMRKESDIIDLEKPVVTYFMPDQANDLAAVSQSGTVNQAKGTIALSGDVVVTSGDKTLNTEELFYDGATRQMTFAQGAVFSGQDMSGSVDNLIWRLDERVIEGQGNVKVELMLKSNPLSKAKTPVS